MGRPTDPLIDRDAAIRAALKIIDEQGLQSFNLALVANKLGVRAPSLYYHFSDKSEILTEVARAILLDAQRPFKSRPESWIDAKVANAISVRRSILKHPNAAPLLLLYPARHTHLTGYEKGIRYLERHGVPAAQHISIITGLEYLTFGSAFLAAAALSSRVREFAPHDPHQFPSLATAIKSNKLSEEAIFEETVRAFLEGFVARAAKSTKGERRKPANGKSTRLIGRHGSVSASSKPA
jgi:AcrR family transcriptional regulator